MQNGYFDNNGIWHAEEGFPTPPAATVQAPAPAAAPPPAADNQPPPPSAPSTIGPWTQTYSPSAWADLPAAPAVPNAPTPNLPTYTPPPAYTPTPFAFSIGDALTSPEYEAITSRGIQQVQGTAAARGTLNDSGTNHALADYLVNAENAQLSNIWNQQYGTWNANEGAQERAYQTNVQNQYVDPYQMSYQRALDLNAPATAQWQAQNGLASQGYQGALAATTARNQFNAQNVWDQYVNAEDLWKFNTTNAINLAGA